MEVISKIGRRKTSVARLYLSAGKGTISINGRTLEDYFPSDIHKIIIKQPLVLVESDGKAEDPLLIEPVLIIYQENLACKNPFGICIH